VHVHGVFSVKARKSLAGVPAQAFPLEELTQWAT
jgi:hypothetical protein